MDFLHRAVRINYLCTFGTVYFVFDFNNNCALAGRCTNALLPVIFSNR